MAGLHNLQINSFVGKFVNLWQNGYEASLNFKTSAGKAEISLQVGLGEVPPLPQVPLHRVPGPSRQRRSLRRADARKAAAEAKSEQETHKEAEQANEEPMDINPETAEVEGKRFAEEASKAAPPTEKVKVEEAKEGQVGDEFGSDKPLENDFDIYTFSYWDTTKSSEAQEAINHIEGKLKQNFERCQVKESDRVYKINRVDKDENEIIVDLKLKKDMRVEHSARGVQTTSQDEIIVSIQKITR